MALLEAGLGRLLSRLGESWDDYGLGLETATMIVIQDTKRAIDRNIWDLAAAGAEDPKPEDLNEGTDQ